MENVCWRSLNRFRFETNELLAQQDVVSSRTTSLGAISTPTKHKPSKTFFSVQLGSVEQKRGGNGLPRLTTNTSTFHVCTAEAKIAVNRMRSWTKRWAVEQTISSSHRVWVARVAADAADQNIKTDNNNKKSVHAQREMSLRRGVCLEEASDRKIPKGVCKYQQPGGEGKRFSPYVPSLKFPGGTEITKYKQERMSRKQRKTLRERRSDWEVESEEIHSTTHSCQAFRHTCVCTYIPRDAVISLISLKCPVIFWFPVYTKLSDHSFTLLLQSLCPSLVCSFSQREWNSPFTRISSSLSLSARKQSELDWLKLYVVRGRIVSLPCPIPFDPRWKK